MEMGDGAGVDRANVVGLGLIGGSIALALAEAGFDVAGSDADPSRLAAALERGVVRTSGIHGDAQVSFVCTPADQAARVAQALLDQTSGAVTDVGSVKSDVCSAILDPRFIGGHPMAGSELDGLDGIDASMFDGAVWVLTPNESTDDSTFTDVASIVRSLGADVIAMTPRRHDEIVAVVSHTPHLVAASLMTLAEGRAEDDVALLRLAAGGFRDMTRVAAGSPKIWLDICRQNKTAIAESLHGLIDRLTRITGIVERGESGELLDVLESARRARLNLPAGLGADVALLEVRVPVPDRPGAAAEVFTLAGELGVNIHDFEVVHSNEGRRGVIVLLVSTAQGDIFRGGLLARGFRPSSSNVVA